MGTKTETKIDRTETRDPWAPAQPYILDTLKGAQDLYNSDVGKNYFPGSTSVPMSWDTSYALDAMQSRAVDGSALNSAAQNQTLDTINGNYFNPTNDFYNTGVNAGLNNNSAELLQPFTEQNVSAADGYYQDIAGGSNQYLDQTFSNASRKISDAVNSNFSKAGRYGSAAHQGKLTEDLSNFATDLYGGAFQEDQNRRLNAANSMQGAFDTDLSRRMAATNSISNIQNQNYDRQFAAANGLNQNFNDERARQMQATMNAGAMADNDYDRLLQVGSINEGQSQRDLQSDIDRFNFLEQNPYNRLAQYANLSMGYGGLGGTHQTNGTETTSQSGFGNALNVAGNFAANMGKAYSGFKFGK